MVVARGAKRRDGEAATDAANNADIDKAEALVNRILLTIERMTIDFV